jgi:hypothetical protein
LPSPSTPGSDTGFTRDILDILEREAIRGTFGLTGRWTESAPDFAHRIAAEGHQLVNHSYNHPSYTGRSTGPAPRVAADIADNVESGFEVIEIVGVGASPSCGVSTTLHLAHAVGAMAHCDPSALDIGTVNKRVIIANVVDGPGMLIAALRHQLHRRGLEVRFREHDLIGELRDAGMLAPLTIRRAKRPTTAGTRRRRRRGRSPVGGHAVVTFDSG